MVYPADRYLSGEVSLMKTARWAMLAFARLMVGCNSASKLSIPANPVRAYNGTASVGDFLTIAIDSNKQTITYKN